MGTSGASEAVRYEGEKITQRNNIEKSARGSLGSLSKYSSAYV
jgi:hypothetical protein